MTFEFNKEELYVLKMIVKTELDELPDLIESADSKDKKELTAYKHKVEKIYNIINE